MHWLIDTTWLFRVESIVAGLNEGNTIEPQQKAEEPRKLQWSFSPQHFLNNKE